MTRNEQQVVAGTVLCLDPGWDVEAYVIINGYGYGNGWGDGYGYGGG